VATIVQLLDKQRLHAACAEVGLPTLPTWFPAGVDEVAKLAGELPIPLVIKARTQVLLSTENHGRIIESREAVVPAYAEWLRKDRYLPGPEKDFGDLAAPMLQSFLEATQGIYSLSGFVDRDGQLLGARAARKVLQRPHRVGVGLCFEAAEVEPEVLESVVRLCRRVGYSGVFEVEFVLHQDRYRLIDFNPRYYGQMQFDCSRGLPLPLFAYLAALGEREKLAAAAAEAGRVNNGVDAYAYRFAHLLLLRIRRLAGTSGAEEAARWQEWYRQHGAHRVDGSADDHDRLPGMVQATAEMWHALRYARGY
jgi:D-aspartate ligase